ncbi:MULTISPECIES: hypothetical protein [Brevibacillus]|nr:MULTISPECIES: hypothetical protein [Brevibacillus]MCG7317814.1 hypothetical protein [Brevibacillus laterosporus]
MRTTDPNRVHVLENKPEGFFYLDYRTTNLKFNIIIESLCCGSVGTEDG